MRPNLDKKHSHDVQNKNKTIRSDAFPYIASGTQTFKEAHFYAFI